MSLQPFDNKLYLKMYPIGVMTNDVKYIDKDTGSMGIMGWRTVNVSANREGTLGSEDIVVTYTMYTMYVLPSN
ncbi:hypothetical protein AK871_14800 [Listeria monocytogenes]|nr:hypothetical protein [Listeria monocytogenes]